MFQWVMTFLVVMVVMLGGCSEDGPVPTELLGQWFLRGQTCQECASEDGVPVVDIVLDKHEARLVVQGGTVTVSASGGDNCASLGGTNDGLQREIHPFELCQNNAGHLRGEIQVTTADDREISFLMVYFHP